MTRLRTVLIALVATACVATFVAGTVVAPSYPPLPVDPFWLVWVGFPVVGGLILVKRPGNRVGWFQLMIGVCAAVSALTTVLYELGTDSSATALVNQLAFTPIFVFVPLLILVFPSGRIPSPGWRPFVNGALTAVVVLTVWLAVRPVEYSINATAFYPNPLGIEALGPYDLWVMGSLRVLLVGFAVACLIQSIRAFRRADRVGRLQVKWVVAPALFMPILFVVGNFIEGLGPDVRDLSNLVVMAAILIGANGVAAGIGVAVFRHRLYGIDKIVSRTVSYTLVIVLLGLALFAVVTGLTTLVPNDEPIVTAIATLTIAALFNPVRRVVLRRVDRRFNRSRYDAELLVEGFIDSLRDRVDREAVMTDWMEVVEGSMEPKHIAVWVKSSPIS